MMCANAQTDLNHRWAHMSEGTYSDVEPHFQPCFCVILLYQNYPKCSDRQTCANNEHTEQSPRNMMSYRGLHR